MKFALACLLSMLVVSSCLAANLTGHWSGEIEVTMPDGSMQTQSGYLDLKQEGATVFGSGGTEAGESLPLEDVQFDGTRLSFTVNGPDGRSYNSTLSVISQDKMEGHLVFALDDGTVIKARLTFKREPAR